MRLNNPFIADNSITTAKIINRAVTLAKSARALCTVSQSAGQSIPNAIATILLWDTETVDTDVIHDLAANTDRLTVPAGYLYARLALFVTWPANATGIRVLEIFKNGAAFTAMGNGTVSQGNATSGISQLVQTGWVTIAAGDIFRASATQDSGGALALLASTRSSFTIELQG